MEDKLNQLNASDFDIFITTLLENKPDNLILEEGSINRIKVSIHRTMWILQQAASTTPCYLLIDEYTKMLNLLIWRFPSVIDQPIIDEVIDNLKNILSLKEKMTRINCGMDISLANTTYLYLIILIKYGKVDDIKKLVYETLFHVSYEVVLASLDFLLILNKELEIENKFLEHLDFITKETIVIDNFKKDPNYTKTLYETLKTAKYLECKYKCLKLLSLEDNTHDYIIKAKAGDDIKISDEIILSHLTRLVESEHENLTHIYLYSLANFLTKRLKESDVSGRYVLDTIRVIFACSSSENNDHTRNVVVGFLEENFGTLISLEMSDLTEEGKFEVRATSWATLVTVLEDDDYNLRLRCSRVITDLVGSSPTLGIRAAHLLRKTVAKRKYGLEILCALALLDFRCQVCLADETDDECRVFDQNEKYNVFLEETVWTVACADEIKHIYDTDDICTKVLNILEDPTLKPTFTRLCGTNVTAFKSVIEGTDIPINPKISVFADKLNDHDGLSDFSLYIE